MKIKRWLSLLLTLTLCVGLLPGTTLATGEDELPEGYEQMYVEDNGNYVTVAEGTAGSGGDILFYIKTGDNYVALNETQQSEGAYVYTDENLAVTCGGSIGETGPGKSGTNWRKQETKPGASGYLYAVSGQSKYAIEAKITGNPNVIYDDKGNSEFTMNAGMEQAFTFSPIIYVDGESTRLVAADYNGETYTFTTTVGSLYWHESFNELAISTAGITSDATGIITITNKNDSTKVYTCEVTVKGTSSGDNEGGNTSPADSGVLYDDKGASEFTMAAGSKYGFPPHIDVDGTKTAITPGDGYEFSCDTQVGTVVWDGTTGGGELSWSVADVSSAVSGKIYATHTESGKVYSCTVNVSVPEEDGDEENTITIDGVVYTQMYVGNDHATTARNAAGAGGDFNFYSKSGDEYSLLNGPDSEFTISCDETVGKIAENGDKCMANWQAGSVKPGAEGYIYAVKGDDLKYAIKATVGAPMMGVYTQTPNVNDLAEGYVVTTNGKYPIDYTSSENKAIYICTGLSDRTASWTFGEAASTNGAVSVVLSEDAKTAIVTLTEGQTGSVESQISVSVVGDNTWYFNLLFTDGTGTGDEEDGAGSGGTPDDGDSNEQKGTITINGEEYAQMYYKSVAGDYVTKIEVDLNGSVSLKENLFANQSGTTAIDVTNVFLVGDNLGELVPPPAPEAWDTNNNAIAGASGYLCAVNEEQRYAIAVSIKVAGGETGGGEDGESGDTSDERPFKLYDAETGGNEIVADSDNNYTVQVTGSNGKTVYFRMNEGSDLSFGEGCSAQYNEVVPDGPPSGLEIISGTLVNETTFSIEFMEGFNEARTAPVTLIAGGKTYSFSITFAVQDGYTLVSDSRPLTENDKIEPGIDSSEWGAAPFEYDTNGDGTPETYYICTMFPMREDETFYHMAYAMGSQNGEYDENKTFIVNLCMGIWTYDSTANSYSLVSGEVKDKLIRAFGESWSVRAYNRAQNGVNAKNYPAVYSWTEKNGWPFGVSLRFGANDAGMWYFEFAGTVNGQTVTMYAADELSFSAGSLEYSAADIDDVNEKLQEWATANHPTNMRYTINLPAGELYGTIQLPFGMGVTINGSTSDERTVLHGGIGGNGGVTVKNIDFEGCGWWKTNWPDNEKFGGEPNYALYTGGGARYEGCTFKNYYHALHCHGGMMFGGSDTVFENNLIALYMNSEGNGGGNLTMEENTFRHNGCAFWLENFGNMFPLNSYHVLRCKFYDNGWDMINLLGKCYFLPGQLFERGGEYGHGKFAGRRDALRQIPVNNVPEKASGIAADVSQDGCGVYTFPVAKNDRFDDYDYSNANAVIGNHHAASWKIPENDLNGKTITVIQDEKGEDAVVWSFGS